MPPGPPSTIFCIVCIGCSSEVGVARALKGQASNLTFLAEKATTKNGLSVKCQNELQKRIEMCPL